MTTFAARALSAAALLVCSIGYARATCTPVAIEQSDYADPAVAAKKAEYALAVISDAKYLAKDKECVRSAMLYLGLAHVRKATPRLIALLGYRQEPRFGHKPRSDDEYPAIAALFRMGEAAVPALVDVLATKDNGSIESTNALDAFMNIYREQLDNGLRTLKQASEKQTDSAARARLRQATQDARIQWCRSSPCAE